MPIAFFFIAVIYSMIGFGGGSSYLVLLVLAGLSYQNIPPTALACNVIVASGGLWHFYRAGHLRIKKILPFLILSIPMAYLGGRFLIGKDFFCLLLGLSLLMVAIRLWLPGQLFEKTKTVSSRQAWMVGLPVGGFLGFFSGLVGIGGGIFLSPILLLMRWVTVKEAAAAASLFIFVNSIAGLIGQVQKGVADFSMLLPLGVAVFIGGQIGSRLGAYHFPTVGLQRILAGLMLYVSFRLLWTLV